MKRSKKKRDRKDYTTRGKWTEIMKHRYPIVVFGCGGMVRLEISIIFVRQRELGSSLHLLVELRQEIMVNIDLWWGQSWGCDKLKGRVADKLPGQPQEGFLKVVVGLGRDVVVLKVLLAVKDNLLGLHSAVLHVDLVAAENDWNVFADANNIAMPVRHILIGHSASYVEHDNRTLALNIVSITKPSKFFLTGGVPNFEYNLTVVGVESKRVNLYAHSCHVFLFKFTSAMTLYECGLSCCAITYQE